jgi:colicin import membrane protein
MKTLLYSSLLLLILPVQAQQTAASTAEQVNAERARIGAERGRAQARVQKEEADCYQHFAVNDCLRDVHVRWRVVLEEFRRQDIVLNDADRQRRAQEETRQIEEKSAARGDAEAQQRRDSARQESAERVRRAGEKQSAAAAGKGVTPPQARASAPQAKTAQSRAEDKKAFEEKQRLAQERKAQRDKALAEKSGPPSKPLPDPP